MGKIDNEQVTLLKVVEGFLPRTKTVRIIAGCVSCAGLTELLIKLPPEAKMYILTGSIAPDLQEEIDQYLDEGTAERYTMVEQAFKSGALAIGFNKDIHMGIWLFELSDDPQHVVIWGSSTITRKGLFERSGEQNDFSFRHQEYRLEEARWNRFAPQSLKVSPQTWSQIKLRCWNSEKPSENSTGLDNLN